MVNNVNCRCECVLCCKKVALPTELLNTHCSTHISSDEKILICIFAVVMHENTEFCHVRMISFSIFNSVYFQGNEKDLLSCRTLLLNITSFEIK